MAAAYDPLLDVVGAYQFFDEFTNPQYNPNAPRPDEEIIHDFENVNAPQPPIPAGHDLPFAPIIPQNFNRVAPQPKDAEQRGFMSKRKPFLPGNPNRWRPIKFLGAGGGGMAGLWEYKPRAGDAELPVRKMVVKEARWDDEIQMPSQMNDEARFLSYLRHSSSAHITHMIGDINLIQPNDPSNVLRTRGGLDRWVGHVGRLFLEFCSMGDLNDLLYLRRMTAKPFDEITLWKFLECFVDGALVLESGNEEVATNANGTKSLDVRFVRHAVNGASEWKPIVHFDIKPDNIFLEEFDGKHPHTPICKFADFGLSEFWPWPRNYYTGQRSFQIETQLRIRGTPKRYAPEQFSKRWNYQDWEASGIAGIYGSKTNVWGIGTLMYSLITFDFDGPPPSRPFTHNEPISGHPPKGPTYGHVLHHYINNPYSKMLIHTIWECLYDQPDHRLSLVQLKGRVQEGFRFATEAARENNQRLFEPWKDFSNHVDAPYISRLRPRH